MADIHDFLRCHMRYAQAKYIENADAHRLPAPVFQPGDMVFLDTRNMRTIRPSRKLDDKNAGPSASYARSAPALTSWTCRPKWSYERGYFTRRSWNPPVWTPYLARSTHPRHL